MNHISLPVSTVWIPLLASGFFFFQSVPLPTAASSGGNQLLLLNQEYRLLWINTKSNIRRANVTSVSGEQERTHTLRVRAALRAQDSGYSPAAYYRASLLRSHRRTAEATVHEERPAWHYIDCHKQTCSPQKKSVTLFPSKEPACWQPVLSFEQ